MGDKTTPAGKPNFELISTECGNNEDVQIKPSGLFLLS
jgi:hypothetical protein